MTRVDILQRTIMSKTIINKYTYIRSDTEIPILNQA